MFSEKHPSDIVPNEAQHCQHLLNINEEVHQYFFSNFLLIFFLSISKQDLVAMHKYTKMNKK